MEAIIRVAILTVSDRSSRGERADASGPALARAVAGRGHAVVATEIVPDERAAIAAALRRLAAGADLVLTTGGTGLSPRDVTPEATLDVVSRVVPGVAEEMRRRSVASTPRAVLSRAVAGVTAEGVLIVNLPGSPSGAEECFGFVADALAHGAAVARGRGGDCAPGHDCDHGGEAR